MNPTGYTLDFVIPQGPTGPTGVAGEIGATGPTGATGRLCNSPNNKS